MATQSVALTPAYKLFTKKTMMMIRSPILEDMNQKGNRTRRKDEIAFTRGLQKHPLASSDTIQLDQLASK